MRDLLTMGSRTVRKAIARTLAGFVEAQQSGNAEVVQRAYEELFALCYENDLELSALLAQVEVSGYEAEPSWPVPKALRGNPTATTANQHANHSHV
ncbi:MAG TPA: hypothetical protein VI455_08500 [Terriglobia bacterium]